MKRCYVWRKFSLLWSILSIRLREPLMDSYMYQTLNDAPANGKNKNQLNFTSSTEAFFSRIFHMQSLQIFTDSLYVEKNSK